MATIPFIAYEISGVKQPTYGSGAANKAYVDAQVVAAGGVENEAFQAMTATANGGIYFDGSFRVSSAAARQASVLGYATISSNAKKGQASGARVLDLFNHELYTPSSIQLGKYYPSALGKKAYASAARVTDRFVHELYTPSSVQLGKYYPSTLGKKAYASAARVVDAFVHENYALSSQFQPVKGWFTASAQKLTSKRGWSQTNAGTVTVTHGLGAIPGNVSIVPSGSVTWSWAVNGVTSTQFVLNISAAGNRDFGWRVQI